MTIPWEALKDQIRSTMPPSLYSLWVAPLQLLEHAPGTLLLGCPNAFSLKWVHDNYLSLLQETAVQISGAPCRIELRVMAPKHLPSPSPSPDEPPSLPFPQTRAHAPTRLLTNLCFERFIVGPCNAFAFHASTALANGDLHDYQTLFLIANTGLGKTHLSQAMGNKILEKAPRTRLFYITAEDFTNEMILALKNNRIDDFKNRYRRSCDVLLLEEVHFLSGKEKTQIELGYTLDALLNDRKKIVLTSSLPPKDIPNLSRELCSRLGAGLVTSIGVPDQETRRKILLAKASEMHLPLSEDILDLFSELITDDVRHMESVLKCLKAKSDLTGVPIDLDLAKEVLHCLVSQRKTISLKHVEALICSYFALDPEILRSKSRKKIHAHPRNLYSYLCRIHTKETLETIGTSINRTHSTVLYASELIEKTMRKDEKLKGQVRFLSERLDQTS